MVRRGVRGVRVGRRVSRGPGEGPSNFQEEAHSPCSFRFRARTTDDLAPLPGLRADELRELLRRHRPRLDARSRTAGSAASERASARRAASFSRSTISFGVPTARAEPEPGRRLESPQTGFVDRGNLRRGGDALALRHGERPQPPALDMRQARAGVDEAQRDLPREQRDHRRRSGALVRARASPRPSRWLSAAPWRDGRSSRSPGMRS